MKELLHLLYLFSFSFHVCDAVSAVHSTVTVKKGDDAMLQWKVPAKNSDGTAFTTLSVRLETKNKLAILSASNGNSVTIGTNGKEEFGDRLTASLADDTFTLVIAKTLESDEHTFKLVATYDLANEFASVKLNVGSPDSSKGTSNSDSGSSSSNTGAIVGGIIGGVLFLIIIIGVYVYCVKKRDRRSVEKEDEEYSEPMRNDLPPKKPPRTGEDDGVQYATYEPKNNQKKLPERVVYSELGPGGRVGPKDYVSPSHYAEAKE